MRSGIYKIINIINNKIYIGSAINLKRRQYEHFRMLQKGIHYNSYLQRSYDKYKEENFIFEVIVNCQKEELIKLEQFYIDTLKPEYNNLPTAGSMLGFKFSDETKTIKSKQATQQIINQKAKGLTNSKLKLTTIEVIEIKKLLAFNKPLKEIGDKFGVAKTTISEIKAGRSWIEIPNYELREDEKYLVNRTNQFSRLQKLTEVQRLEIIKRVLEGETHLKISQDYPITKSGVGGIMRSYRKFNK